MALAFFRPHCALKVSGSRLIRPLPSPNLETGERVRPGSRAWRRPGRVWSSPESEALVGEEQLRLPPRPGFSSSGLLLKCFLISLGLRLGSWPLAAATAKAFMNSSLMLCKLTLREHKVIGL